MHSRFPRLVLTPSVPAGWRNRKLLLDEKAASGLRLYSEMWPGPIRCIFRDIGAGKLPFGSEVEPKELPIEVFDVPSSAGIPDGLLEDAAVVLGSADNHLDLALARQCRRLGIPLTYVIEYILETRLQIIDLEGHALPRRLRRKLWTIHTEHRRRRAFRISAAIQSNGTAAAAAYGRLARSSLTFFDTRLRRNMIATDQDMNRRRARLSENQPLRLAFSGRLEPMKGVDHLIEVAQRLIAAGTKFQLDIFGYGSREAWLREAVERLGLADHVRISGPLHFETELVPWMRQTADLFLCCHPQSDPSCTYLETLGCGVPIVGFANRAWAGILKAAPVGWSVSIGDSAGLARNVIALDLDRASIVAATRQAREFARKHCFETTFDRRVRHLLDVASRARKLETDALAV
jgi:glycosyltransferase involved in cell wall biosynthesis